MWGGRKIYCWNILALSFLVWICENPPERQKNNTKKKNTKEKEGGTGGKEEALQTIFYSRAD